jgi:phosphatidylserine/phosphatidylglycerophosphate/cardiolipin synthase-like enzyme
MHLIIQPKDGLVPLIAAIKKATKQIDITIFRFGLKELQRALESAVARGVKVHALIAHTSGGGQKRLRRLELEMLSAGVTVSRTDDDLLRYHYKMLLIDREVLYTQAFNYTRLDIEKSRTMAVATKNKAIVSEAIKLFEADVARQPYSATHDNFLVSPENARAALARFIKSAKKQLLIYDMKISDRPMIKLLQERVKAGVDVRIIGKVGKKGEGLTAEKMPGMRLHVRAMLRDGQEMFLGSMSLRALELDKRREVGVIVKEQSAAKRFREIFEEDWSKTDSAKKKADKNKADKNKKDEKREAEAVAS